MLYDLFNLPWQYMAELIKKKDILLTRIQDRFYFICRALSVYVDERGLSYGYCHFSWFKIIVRYAHFIDLFFVFLIYIYSYNIHI